MALFNPNRDPLDLFQVGGSSIPQGGGLPAFGTPGFNPDAADPRGGVGPPLSLGGLGGNNQLMQALQIFLAKQLGGPFAGAASAKIQQREQEREIEERRRREDQAFQESLLDKRMAPGLEELKLKRMDQRRKETLAMAERIGSAPGGDIEGFLSRQDPDRLAEMNLTLEEIRAAALLGSQSGEQRDVGLAADRELLAGRRADRERSGRKERREEELFPLERERTQAETEAARARTRQAEAALELPSGSLDQDLSAIEKRFPDISPEEALAFVVRARGAGRSSTGRDPGLVEGTRLLNQQREMKVSETLSQILSPLVGGPSIWNDLDPHHRRILVQQARDLLDAGAKLEELRVEDIESVGFLGSFLDSNKRFKVTVAPPTEAPPAPAAPAAQDGSPVLRFDPTTGQLVPNS